MARADLLLKLVNTGIAGDIQLFRKTVKTLIQDEHSKRHYVIAEQLSELLRNPHPLGPRSALKIDPTLQNVLSETSPRRTLSDLILPQITLEACQELIREHNCVDLLRTHDLYPKHKVLLVGPPGNGKTTLAEALASELEIQYFIVKYEGLIDSRLGTTAKQLDRVFCHIKQQPCVIFFDEFDAISKERNDMHEIGEIKRVVNSLLIQIDNLPSHVVIIAATNHQSMMDKAIWRRFQVHIELPKPTKKNAIEWIKTTEARVGHNLGFPPQILAEELRGCSYAELEEFGFDVQRSYILNGADTEIESIAISLLKRWKKRIRK